MDVSLLGSRVLLGFLALFFLTLISCGNRYDLANDYGRRSRIDDANFHLSRGECTAAAEAIDPLFNSIYANDEVRLIKSSTYACLAHFQLLNFVAKIAGGGNLFQGLALALDNATGDDARTNMANALSVLTLNGLQLNANQRIKSVNTYMVFLSFGAISAIIRNYGSPAVSTGAQGANLIYDGVAGTSAGEMSDLDACALAAAFSTVSNSYPLSDLNDSSTASAVAGMDALCVAAGVSSCAALSRVTTACGTGGTPEAVQAAGVVAGVNAAW